MNRARSIRLVSSRPGRPKGFAYRGLLFAVPVVLAVPLVAYFGLPKLSMSSEETGPMMHTVQRGTFLHDVTESGSVESANNVEIRCEVESHGGGTMIIWIVPEGTYVEPAPDWQPFDPSAVFQALDKNADGALGTPEVPAWMKPRLSTIDADGDGTVDRSEFKWGSLDPTRMFYALDKDSDGNLGEEEIPKWLKPHLASIDADGDGAIDPREFKWESLVPERVFLALDVNGNGRLEKDESPDWMNENLSAIDADGDGAVDRNEFKLEPFDPGTVLSALDDNGDGQLERGEAPDWIKPYLWAIDTNGDGTVDRSEFGVMWEPPDLLVKLDSSSLEDKRMQQQIVCNSSEAAVIQATNNVETARITLKEYLEGI
ncbi:MAG: EF-hand domain-containing protein, partial [Planctomycetota bacterium]